MMEDEREGGERGEAQDDDDEDDMDVMKIPSINDHVGLEDEKEIEELM